MAARRVNPRAVKLHRSYSVPELAACLGVHKNTVRLWQREGMAALDGSRPTLFQGAAVQAYLTKRNAARKCPCPPGTFYCFRCQEPRPPALGLIEYIPFSEASGNLRAICGSCDTIMHRRARKALLAEIMPGSHVQVAQATPRLSGNPSPSLNCDNGRQATA